MTDYEQRCALIREDLLTQTSTDPAEILRSVTQRPFVRVHGPEHHFLDGAAFLIACRNAGAVFDAEAALCELTQRAQTMPGAMCGHWGVCGAAASLGAALSVLHGTGPLSGDSFYGQQMQLTSEILHDIAAIGGPRCCKRNAMIALRAAVRFARDVLHIPLSFTQSPCAFSERNTQCLQNRCPFYISA